MCSEGSSLLSRLPTTQHALVFMVGLWALGHQLCPVLLCWLHWPCCEMWSLSSIRAWTGCCWRAKKQPNPWLYHPGVDLKGLVRARSVVRCLAVWLPGMRPRCLVVSQLCLLGSCSSLHCTINKFDIDSSGLCNCLCTAHCYASAHFISFHSFFFINK